MKQVLSCPKKGGSQSSDSYHQSSQRRKRTLSGIPKSFFHSVTNGEEEVSASLLTAFLAATLPISLSQNALLQASPPIFIPQNHRKEQGKKTEMGTCAFSSLM
ncbi:hypothetical protein OPV22_021447 [Ensete ventricosum]|uniref:Protein dehydration-induced 19 C-terminal domain-containing protein n=1 Tax=Ensete ventricosum TaxID=4639 RepID=A0AAV8QIV4_ENSVE|nr:hypothetical protein OPV22_021447 [Ensete ventricosum]